MEAFADWDLLAVVRSCSSTTTTTTTSTSATTATSPPPDPHFSPPPLPPNHHPSFPLSPPNPTPPPSTSSHELLFGLPTTLFDPPTTSFLGSQQDLQDICKPSLISNPSTSSCTVNYSSFQSLSSPSSSSLTSPVSSSSSSVLAGGSFKIGEAPQLRRLFRPSQVVFGAPSTTPSTSQPQRTKKRKNWVKKVCHVPAEGLSNDMWAWRKYGQKPIKGSPYPRGYYRCSSSKGCLARKQVERNRSDPKMFIVTYTAEHNHPMPTHRNSLAGSTRQKPNTSAGNEAPPSDQPTCSSPSAASLSPPTTEKSESKTEGDEIMKKEDANDMGLSDLMLDDDFYVGFEKIDGEDTGECFSDHFSPPMELPWLTSSSTTATAASGS